MQQLPAYVPPEQTLPAPPIRLRGPKSGNISALHIKEKQAKENVQSVKGRNYTKTVIKMFLSFDGIIYISFIYICIHTCKMYIHTL